MTIVEKAAYLKGLCEGVGMTADTREGRLWAALNELLADMAHEIEELQAGHLDMADALDELTEDLNFLADCGPDPYDPDDETDDDFDAEEDDFFSDDETDEDFDAEPGVLYDVTCPVCGGEITLDEQMLERGSIECPGCGETLEFDLDDED